MDLVKTNGKNKFNHGLQSVNNVGVQGANTLSVKEYGDGVHHITKIVLTNFVIGALAAAEASLCLESITPLYSLPSGAQFCKCSYANIGVSCEGTAVTPDVGLGLSPGDGSESALLSAAGATLENVLTGFAIADTETGAKVESSNVTPQMLGLTSDKDIYLNAAGDWNADNDGDLVANGEIVLIWDTI